jgi:hypothetical protein
VPMHAEDSIFFKSEKKSNGEDAYLAAA